MKNKSFYILFWVILGVCAAITLAHLIYVIYAYQHCSIIYFVGKELW